MRFPVSIEATLLLLGIATSAPVPIPQLPAAQPASSFAPRVRSVTRLGVASDDFLNRDSCASTKFGTRALWTCRDTQFVVNGQPTLPIISSSASWSDLNADGTPPLTPNGLRMYGALTGNPYFPIQADSCPGDSAGQCGNGVRSAIWPDSAPLVVGAQDDGSGGPVTAYTWIRKFKINADLGNEGSPDPGTTLYRITGSGAPPSSGDDALPQIAVAQDNFWAEGEISFGNYGGFVHDGYAYLYGMPSSRIVALARVPEAAVEDRSQYEYYVNGAWTRTVPSMNDPGATIPNAGAGGQGTFYYSRAWNRFVWIGQAHLSVSATFMITTAERPEGPWETPAEFYQGENGSYALGAYTLVAHPGLVPEGQDGRQMIISWTKNDQIADGNAYSTPIARVEWEDM